MGMRCLSRQFAVNRHPIGTPDRHPKGNQLVFRAPGPMLDILYRALAVAELQAPIAAQGEFIVVWKARVDSPHSRPICPGWGGYQPRTKSQEQLAVERRRELAKKFPGDISELVAIAAKTRKKPKRLPPA
jgi:hypothetical protein